jgi:hypothetical protein
MIRKMAAIFVVLASLVASVSLAGASTVYTYDGNPLNIGVGSFVGNSISGEFTVGSQLGSNFSGAVTPTQFSFSNGLFSLNNSNSSTYSFNIKTSSAGDIVSWMIAVAAGPAFIATNTLADATGILIFGASNILDAGTWTTSSAATPLPDTLALFLSGVGLIGLLFWRGKRELQASA